MNEIKRKRLEETKRLHALKGFTFSNSRETADKTYWTALESYEDTRTEQKLMSSFYRFCGLEERLSYLNNDSKMQNYQSYINELESKAENWRTRLNNQFSNYGIKLVYFGYLPTLCDDKNCEVLSRHFF